MKIAYTYIIIVFFFFSCQKKETIGVSKLLQVPIKKDTLKLLFSDCIGDGRFHNQLSIISYSDSIFFISSPLGESKLYLKGKLIMKKKIIDYNDYDSINEKFHLKKMDVLKFAHPSLNYQFKENSACTELKSLNNKILFHSVIQSKSGTIFQYIAYKNEIPKLKICNKNGSYIFNIKIEELIESSYIKLIDITGDGKEELFVFSNDNSYPAICFDVFQINYLE